MCEEMSLRWFKSIVHPSGGIRAGSSTIFVEAGNDIGMTNALQSVVKALVRITRLNMLANSIVMPAGGDARYRARQMEANRQTVGTVAAFADDTAQCRQNSRDGRFVCGGMPPRSEQASGKAGQECKVGYDTRSKMTGIFALLEIGGLLEKYLFEFAQWHAGHPNRPKLTQSHQRIFSTGVIVCEVVTP